MLSKKFFVCAIPFLNKIKRVRELNKFSLKEDPPYKPQNSSIVYFSKIKIFPLLILPKELPIISPPFIFATSIFVQTVSDSFPPGKRKRHQRCDKIEFRCMSTQYRMAQTSGGAHDPPPPVRHCLPPCSGFWRIAHPKTTYCGPIGSLQEAEKLNRGG